MNFRQLEIFRTVIEAGSMTGAARKLNISQPGVTKAILALEESCGYPLFIRQAGSITPTPEAWQLNRSVERVFVDIDEVRRVSLDIRDKIAGHLSISAFPSLAARFLPRLLSDYLRQRPDVKISLQASASRQIVATTIAQQTDIGLSVLQSDDASIETEHLHRVERVCVLPPGHRLASAEAISLSDLRDEPFISLHAFDPERIAIEHAFSNLGIGRNDRIETRHSESACAFVANGLGVTIVDPFTPAAFGDAVVTRRLDPPVYLNLWLLWPRHRVRSKVAAEFAETLRASLQARFPGTASDTRSQSGLTAPQWPSELPSGGDIWPRRS
ncbi:LysR substrate-binding domain-containing protein [Breoghania sp.]|uniref:LysR family transcriptional regulator n=1 Tax=Breoghania sp. TaxID=2065378 RepID=UPI002AA86875|nr:LysR substrate-binding domain-containing protein [Breoghania sp.]